MAKQKDLKKKITKPNKIGFVRKFSDGNEYELKSTEIVTEFGKTYRDSWWMSVKDFDGKPITKRFMCEITNQPDVDVTSIDEKCLNPKQ